MVSRQGMTRSGNIVRNSAGQIVCAPEGEMIIVKEQVADKIARSCEGSMARSPRGRDWLSSVMRHNCFAAGAVGSNEGAGYAQSASREQLDDDYRAALSRYLDAASQAALNMDVIVGLASVAERDYKSILHRIVRCLLIR